MVDSFRRGETIAQKAPQERVLAESRRAAIAELLRSAGSVTVAQLEQRFGISPMTARRDLSDLERQGLARRTHGGAVLPAITAHEDSFATRLETETAAKAALADEAVQLVDRSKLATRGLSAIGPVSELAGVITHGVPNAELAGLRATGV